MRIAALKREEDSLSRERERLEAEKMTHIRSAADSLWAAPVACAMIGGPGVPPQGLTLVATSVSTPQCKVPPGMHMAVTQPGLTLVPLWLQACRGVGLAGLYQHSCGDPLTCVVHPSG